jgi:purine-cytosine permease-like protein
MPSSDDPLEDEAGRDPLFGSGFAEPIARRSTYTPPPRAGRHTSMPVPDAATQPPAPGSPSEPSAPDAPREPPLPEAEPEAPMQPPVFENPINTLPHEAAEPAVPPPPTRQSLSVPELAAELEAAVAEPGGTGGALDELERQLRLRVEEVAEYREWEETMLLEGTPDAMAALDQVRPEFEQLAAETMSIAIIPAHASAPPEAEPGGTVEPYLEPLPEPDVRPELRLYPPLSPPGPEPYVIASADPPLRAPGLEAEEFGPEPTPEDRRVGAAVRLFWLWFAPNSSLAAVALGAVLFSLGMSLRQAVIATLVGVVVSFVPLALGTLAGRRSGQPTMIVSRATFGLRGNALPAFVAFVSRVFWGGALLWLLGEAVASVLVGAGLQGMASRTQLTVLSIGTGFVVALTIAFFGYRFIEKLQLGITVLAIIGIVGLVALTASRIDLVAALRNPDGPLTLVLTGAVLVFSVVGLAWANSSGDLARYQRMSRSGAASMLTSSSGAAVPAFVLIAYGALLAASDPAVATGLLADPLGTLGGMLPPWYPVPLLAASVLGLLSGVVVTVYSGSFALVAVGVRLKQTVATLLVAVLVFLIAWGMSRLGGNLATLFLDLATTLAVPVAAWVGIFGAEVMMRGRRYHGRSLLYPGGAYPAFRWSVLAAYVGICVVGFAFTAASAAGLDWQGFGFRALGVPLDTGIGASDVGVFVALALGLLAPLALSRGEIRRQESVELAE